MIDADFIKEIAELTNLAIGNVRTITVALPGTSESGLDGKRVWGIWPKEMLARDLTDGLLARLPNPERRTGTSEIHSLASLVAFINRMQEPHSILVADRPANQLSCIFDYHDAVNAVATAKDKAAVDPGQPVDGALPQWGSFRCFFKFPFSEQWKAWSGKNKAPLTQFEFADWIEENISDIVEPEALGSDAIKKLAGQLGLRLSSSTDLIKTARGIKMHADEAVEDAVNTTTGEIKVSYSQDLSEPESKRPAADAVPSAFLIGVPVYNGGVWYQLLVRLRFRFQRPRVTWFYDIYQIKKAELDAFESSCELVRDQTRLPLYYGVAPGENVIKASTA